MTVLRAMAMALGGDVAGGGILCPGPGHSPRDRSLSVKPSSAAPDGFIVHSHAGDDWRECRAHVLTMLGRPAQRVGQFARAQPRTSDNATPVRRWGEAIHPKGTLVERYLSSRGLILPDDIAGSVLRFHPACPWGGEGGAIERRPCMLTAFRSIEGNELVAVQRTLLSSDGRKLDRKNLGSTAGAAIKIDDDTNVEHGLIIGEGFETCLSARQLGLKPVWALGSADAIGVFPILSGVEALTLLAETDAKGTNAKNIRTCGNRWSRAGREVIVATPFVRGDMNEALRA